MPIADIVEYGMFAVGAFVGSILITQIMFYQRKATESKQCCSTQERIE